MIACVKNKTVKTYAVVTNLSLPLSFTSCYILRLALGVRFHITIPAMNIKYSAAPIVISNLNLLFAQWTVGSIE